MTGEEPDGWVVDTSVAVKWFLNEPHSDLAEDFLEAGEAGRIRLLAPDSLVYEAANVFWVRRRDGVTREMAAEFLESLKLVNMESVGPEELFPEAEAMAFEVGISPYDAVFARLAVLRNCGFISADAELVEALRPVMSGVHLLSEKTWRLPAP